jgi:hypothetical protein
MDKRLLFDLLEHPICAVGDGNLVVFDSPETVRQVAFRGTEDQIVDVSKDQGTSPGLVTRHDVFLKSGGRPLAFRTERFGQVVAFSSVYPAIVHGGSSDARNAALLALNTVRGAWIVEAADDALNVITNEPLPLVLSSYWEQQGTPTFGGGSLRVAQTTGDDPEYAVGSPYLLTVERTHPRRKILARPLSEWIHLDRWVGLAPANLKDNPRFTRGVDAEICVAGEGDRVAVAFTGLYDWYDPLDVRDRFLATHEIFVLVFGRTDSGALERVGTYVSAMASLRTQTTHFLYIGENRGGGPEVGSLQRVRLDASPAGETVTVNGIDPSLRCKSFHPCFHPRIGYFGTLRAGTGNDTGTPVFVHSDDGIEWTVVGRRETVKLVAPG